MRIRDLAHGVDVERPEGDFWTFGYGSLIWNPEFPFVERVPALLLGYHRDACIASTRYRGTRTAPGLVVGLRRGGSCRGVAFRLAEADVEAAVAALHARELINRVYHARFVPVRLADGRRVSAYAFISDPRHAQFAGGLSLEEKAALIARGRGERGTAIAYFSELIDHLERLGIRDGALHRLVALARRM